MRLGEYKDKERVPMEILDCTLRDGGYYTDWDFDSQTVSAYAQAMRVLPVDAIEVGYRSLPDKTYLGQFGYCPVSTIEHIKNITGKKIAVMLNEKSVLPADLDSLLKPVSGLVDRVRIAVDPKNFSRAVVLARAIKGLGFQVSFNMMYMSTWNSIDGIYDKLKYLNGVVDYFCMVDSFGGTAPQEVKSIISSVRSVSSVPIGFHGHNNLQFALVNSLMALDCGATSVDATVLGMGRGAGNLKLELLLTYMNSRAGLDIDFNALGEVLTAFEPLRKKHAWGTSLPYMLSGANGIPQKEVMEWVSNRVYSFNTIVRTLDERRSNQKLVKRFPVLLSKKRYKGILLIGGGPSANIHRQAIVDFLRLNPDVAMVFSTSRHAGEYLVVDNQHFYCLAGDEGKRFMTTVGTGIGDGICVLPPSPREMCVDVPNCVKNRTYELEHVGFDLKYQGSVTTIALQLASELTDGTIWVVGYDGYSGLALSEKELALMRENKEIFCAFREAFGDRLVSLVPTLYNELTIKSVYQFL